MPMLHVALVLESALAFAAPTAPPRLGSEPRAQAIIGGESTAPGEYDGVVALMINGFSCTGTVVAPRLILTAAHCLVSAELGGSVLLYYGDNAQLGGVEADGWGMHPQFCRDCPSDAQDIYDYGYVTIPYDFVLPGGYITPIVDQDEWDEAMRRGEPMTMVGYGANAFIGDEAVGGGVKRKVDVKVRRFSPEGIEFLAGGDQHDTCVGDSGGPAFVRLASGATRLAGITSRGSMPCGSGGLYGAPYPSLCWVREETGIDLVGAGCSACDCLDTSPPPIDDGGCGCSGDAPRSSGIAALAIAALWLRRRRRQRS
ncbi:MAG: trypsin-like serine protease [Deltaproteobacteria bacterium]|nr:trypsin-like serine protease [Nannocystaceae bacterium]